MAQHLASQGKRIVHKPTQKQKGQSSMEYMVLIASLAGMLTICATELNHLQVGVYKPVIKMVSKNDSNH
jgi:hypothetical protein